MPAEQDDLSTWQPGIDYPEAVTADLESRITELEAELLAAQERETENFEAMMDERRKAIDSAEREKALRDRVEDVREQMHGPLREKLWEALVGSPSEKPGSEQKQKTLSTSDYTTTMATGAGVREDLSEKPGSEEEK